MLTLLLSTRPRLSPVVPVPHCTRSITSTLPTDRSLMPGGKVRCLRPIQSIQTAIQQSNSNFTTNSERLACDHTYSTQFTSRIPGCTSTRGQSLTPSKSDQTSTTVHRLSITSVVFHINPHATLRVCTLYAQFRQVFRHLIQTLVRPWTSLNSSTDFPN